MLDVGVAQTDATFTVAAGNTRLVARAAVDADAGVSGGYQAQEPVAIGGQIAATVLEVVLPTAGGLYLAYLKRVAKGALGGLHVTAALLVAKGFRQTYGVVGHQQGVLARYLIHVEPELLLRYHDKTVLGLHLISVHSALIALIGHIEGLLAHLHQSHGGFTGLHSLFRILGIHARHAEYEGHRPH